MQIKFRGQRVDNKEWVEGYYVCMNDRGKRDVHIIFDNPPTNPFNWEGTIHRSSYVEVLSETLGMFTGLKDKNGKEIYGAVGEKGGDIINWLFNDLVNAGQKLITRTGISKVIWENELCMFGFRENNQSGIWHLENPDELEVIGNEMDNPEILEKVKEKS